MPRGPSFTLAAIVDQAARLGWEKLPDNVRIADDQGRPPLRIPREIWQVLDGVFKARDEARKAN